MTEIFAVRPPGTSTVIHLEIPGYKPSSARTRSTEAVLCNAFVRRDRNRVLLADALAWTAPPAPSEPHEQWRWCRPCLGHAVDAAGLAEATVRAVAAATDPPDSEAAP